MSDQGRRGVPLAEAWRLCREWDEFYNRGAGEQRPPDDEGED